MPIAELIQRLIATGIGAGAGFFLCISVCNHYALQLRDHPGKFVLIQILFIASTGGLAWLGFVTGLSLWTLLPAAIFIVLLTLETRTMVEGFKLEGSRPVASETAIPRLTKPVTTTDLGILSYELEHHACPVDQLRIAHVSDIHINDRLPESYYLEVADRINAQQPDLVFYTGDFVSYSRFIPKLDHMLERIHARLGQYAILGNHDYWSNPDAVRETLQRHNIHWVGAEPASLDLGEGTGRLIISGCEKPWGAELANVTPTDSDLWLVLSHTPDTIYELSDMEPAAVFAGHCHAGQFHIPMIGPIVTPSHFGRRFIHGHYLVKNTHLYLTAGIGASSPALRVYCHPDFFVVDIRKPGVSRA